MLNDIQLLNNEHNQFCSKSMKILHGLLPYLKANYSLEMVPPRGTVLTPCEHLLSYLLTVGYKTKKMPPRDLIESLVRSRKSEVFPHEGQALRLLGSSPWHIYLNDRSIDCFKGYPTLAMLAEADERPYGDYVQALQRSLIALRTMLPNFSAEHNLLVQEYVLTEGDAFYSGSSLNHFGCVLVGIPAPTMLAERSLDASTLWLFYFEHAIHEAAHSRLFLHQFFNKLFDNPPEQLYDSPVRVDKRPINGILHAVFVLCRIHAAFSQSLNFLDPWRNIVERRLAILSNMIQNGLKSLDSHAKFTAQGRRLFDAMASYADYDPQRPLTVTNAEKGRPIY
jgi:HEXXH motif-containing protein